MKEAKDYSDKIFSKIDKVDFKSQDKILNKVIRNMSDIDFELSNATINCFMSHTWANNQHSFAKYLSKRLNKYKDISAWLDEDQILMGEHIYDKINDTLDDKVSVFICILSEEYLDSGNCKVELSKAAELSRNMEMAMIPIVYSNCQIPLELQGLLWGDFRDTIDDDGKIMNENFNYKLKILIKSIRNLGKKVRTTTINIGH